MRGIFGFGLVIVAAGSALLTTSIIDHQAAGKKEVAALHATEIATETPTPSLEGSDLLRHISALLHADANSKVPGKPAGDGSGYTGNDTCQWANDGECDDPDIGTGACTQGTDYSDCHRIATGMEDNSCQWANDGECDEPAFGTGACTQATDTADCGAIAHLRFQHDGCATAFDGVCNDPEGGDGTCDTRTDRADCLGRERPMQISDHYFGHDDRVILDTSVMPWAVIGQVTDPDGGACTATLVAENVLITAAHCIEFEDRIDPAGEFETAYARDGGSLTAQVTDYFLSPDRAEDRANSDEPAGTDWALLRIDQPLGRELGFLGTRGLVREGGNNGARDAELYQAGYSWDTGAHLSGNLRCSIVDLEDENTMAHDCDTTRGDSGSPFLVMDGDEYFVVGTDSTFRIEPNVPAMNIATRSEAWLDYLPQFISGEIGSSGDNGKPEGKPAK